MTRTKQTERRPTSPKRPRIETSREALRKAVINEDNETFSELLEMGVSTDEILQVLETALENQYIDQEFLAFIVNRVTINDELLTALYKFYLDDLEMMLAQAIVNNPGCNGASSYEANSFIVRCLEDSGSTNYNAFVMHLERMVNEQKRRQRQQQQAQI